MDKIDVELLWTLKQSSPHTMEIQAIKKKNKALSKSENLLEKLERLKSDGLIESRSITGKDTSYTITKKGDGLIWKGDTWEPIFNLIRLVDPEKYASNEIRRITNKSLVECVREIEFLRKELKLIEGKSKGFKLHFVLSEKGRSYDFETNL